MVERVSVKSSRICAHQDSTATIVTVREPKTFFRVAALAAVLSVAIWAGAVPPANLPPVPNTVSSIKPEEMRMHLEFLASDVLGGRYTLAPNFAISARYLAAHLEAYGFHGAGEYGSFLQTVAVMSTQLDPTQTSLELTMGDKTSTYNSEDFVASPGTAIGAAQGEIVFVGAGISCPSQNHDDYAGLDVRGKLVLLAGAATSGLDISRIGEKEQGIGAAQAHGAVGVLQIPSQRFADLMKNRTFRERT